MWAPLVTIGLLMIFQAKMKTTQPVVKHVGQFSSVIVSWWDYLWKNSVRNIKLERKLPMPVKLILRGNCYNFFGSWLVKQQRVWGFQSMVDVGYDVHFTATSEWTDSASMANEMHGRSVTKTTQKSMRNFHMQLPSEGASE